MAYLGRGLDKISNIEVLDNITFDGSSSYSITKGSVAFTPNSAQSCLISIDGVVQATNFSVNSSTIDFGVAIPSTSVCNFFLHYGTGVMTVPSDGSVTTAKLGSNAVSSAKMFSGFANGITMADQWRLSANYSYATTGTVDLTANWERNDTNFSLIGTGMTESSGIFSFPSTGIYRISAFSTALANGGARSYIQIKLFGTTDNFVSVENNLMQSSSSASANNYYASMSGEANFDVTDISTHKIKMGVRASSNTIYAGTSTSNETSITFTRLGDT